MREKAHTFLDRTRRAPELQAHIDARQRRLQEAEVNSVFAEVMSLLVALVMGGISFVLSLIGGGALLTIIANFLIGVFTLFALFSLEALLLSLITITSVLVLALLNFVLLGSLWDFLEHLGIEFMNTIAFLSEPEEDHFYLTPEEEASFEFQSEVAQSAFEYVRITNDNRMSWFLADFLLKAQHSAAHDDERVHRLISIAAKPIAEDRQRWIKHMASLMDRVLKSPTENNDNRRAIVISCLSAIFIKNNEYCFSHSRQELFYSIFQEMERSHELFACLRDQSVPKDWFIYGKTEYSTFSADLLRMLSRLNYDKGINQNQNYILGFNPEELFGLVLKGLDGLKQNKEEQLYHQHIFEVLLPEIRYRREQAHILPILNACEAFYIKEGQFYEGLTSFFHYLEANNQDAYAACSQMPLSCLLFLEPGNEQRKAKAVNAVVHLYQKYPTVFSDLIDQVIAGNGFNGNEVGEALRYLASGLDNYPQVQAVLEEKIRGNVFVPQEDEDSSELLNEVDVNEEQMPTLDMERQLLKDRLAELAGTEQFGAIIRLMCQSADDGIDSTKVALLFTKIIHGGTVLGIFTSSLDAGTQLLLDRVVEVIYRWVEYQAEHTKRLDVEDEVGTAARALLMEIYEAVENNAENHKSYDLQGLRESYRRLGFDLEVVNHRYVIHYQYGF